MLRKVNIEQIRYCPLYGDTIPIFEFGKNANSVK